MNLYKCETNQMEVRKKHSIIEGIKSKICGK